ESNTKNSHDNIIFIKINFKENKDKIKVCNIFDSKKILYLTRIKSKDKKNFTFSTNFLDRSNKLIIKNISLKIKKYDIERKFSYYGKIERIIFKGTDIYYLIFNY